VVTWLELFLFLAQPHDMHYKATKA